MKGFRYSLECGLEVELPYYAEDLFRVGQEYQSMCSECQYKTSCNKHPKVERKEVINER